LTTQDQLSDVRLWLAEQGCILELNGEVGFGRECVGVLWQTHYVDTPGSGYNDWPEGMNGPDDRLMPPDDVDAYHKHDCLAVLGRDDQAIDGLLRWVQKIRDNGGRIVVRDRKKVPGTDTPMNWMFHGRQHAIVEFSEVGP
jgi:hypothetical protein